MSRLPLNFSLLAPEACDRQDARVNIFQDLRALIIEGAIPPGTDLPSQAIAQHYGVSRTPVREALRQLEVQGLAESAGYQCSLKVCDYLPPDAQHLEQVRTMLEPAALLAMSRERRIEIQPILLEAVDGLIAKSGLQASEAYRELVLLLCSCSGNPLLIGTIATLLEDAGTAYARLFASVDTRTLIAEDLIHLVSLCDDAEDQQWCQAYQLHLSNLHAALREAQAPKAAT